MKEPKKKATHKGMANLTPFTKDGINGKTFQKWTEEVVHQKLDELEEWLTKPNEIKNDKGEVIEVKPNENIFFMDFLITKGLYIDWVSYVSGKFASASERINYFKAIQEQKLVSLGVYGKTNPTMTKFVLSANYGYTEKTENKNTNENTIIWKEEKTYE